MRMCAKIELVASGPSCVRVEEWRARYHAVPGRAGSAFRLVRRAGSLSSTAVRTGVPLPRADLNGGMKPRQRDGKT